MLKQLIFWNVLLVSLMLGVPCGTAMAEDDGSGGPVDDVNVYPRPVIKYVMASPRACLIEPPIWSTNAYYLPTGDAENFHRANGAIKVPLGAKVIFCLSRQAEGVWYSRSYGCLATSLELQWCRQCKCAECDCKEYENNDDSEVKPDPWVTIGRDGAKDVRKGPSIGRAKVGIPIKFRRPGIYYLRGIVRTVAHPWYPRPLEPWQERLIDETDQDGTLPRIPPAVDKDVVYVRVHVVDLPIIQIEPEDNTSDDPDAKYIRPIPKDMDIADPERLSADLNDDEIVNIEDFVLFTEQWGQESVLPFNEED